MASYPTKEPSSSPSPYPTPVLPPPPPPSSPSPSECGDYNYCPAGQTCCCELELFGFCFTQGCCPYESGVCCDKSEYCCPSDYPICDVNQGLCLKEYGDYLGVAAKKRRIGMYKSSWSSKARRDMDQPLQWKWKRNQFVEMLKVTSTTDTKEDS